ncbi:unnamed protein product [Closterium sp. NIES-64]|nr:unnamed protein product [Closterium sp. NIES-64]
MPTIAPRQPVASLRGGPAASPPALAHPARAFMGLHAAAAAAASLRVARAAGAAVRRGVRAAAASEGENGSLRTQPGQEQEAEARGEGGEADPVLEEARRRRAEWQAPAPTRVEEILDVLFVFGGLLDRPFGSGQSIAAAGRVVLARVEKEVQALRQEGEGGSAAAAAPVRTGAAAVPRSGMEGVAAEGAAAGGGGEGGKGGGGEPAAGAVRVDAGGAAAGGGHADGGRCCQGGDAAEAPRGGQEPLPAGNAPCQQLCPHSAPANCSAPRAHSLSAAPPVARAPPPAFHPPSAQRLRDFALSPPLPCVAATPPPIPLSPFSILFLRRSSPQPSPYARGPAALSSQPTALACATLPHFSLACPSSLIPSTPLSPPTLPHTPAPRPTHPLLAPSPLRPFPVLPLPCLPPFPPCTVYRAGVGAIAAVATAFTLVPSPCPAHSLPAFPPCTVYRAGVGAMAAVTSTTATTSTTTTPTTPTTAAQPPSSIPPAIHTCELRVTCGSPEEALILRNTLAVDPESMIPTSQSPSRAPTLVCCGRPSTPSWTHSSSLLAPSRHLARLRPCNNHACNDSRACGAGSKYHHA